MMMGARVGICDGTFIMGMESARAGLAADVAAGLPVMAARKKAEETIRNDRKWCGMVTYTDGCRPGFVFRATDYYTASGRHEGCVLYGTIGTRRRPFPAVLEPGLRRPTGLAMNTNFTFSVDLIRAAD